MRSALLVLILGLVPRAVAAPQTGEAVYRARCASCHGATGEGVPDKYPKPLAGDRSVPQLARQIAKTMPEDDPGSCVGEEADRVARYIHDTFYSQAARERNKPPRVELSRLTVAQYRNAIADLVGSFRFTAKWDERRGLRAEYFNSREFQGDKKVIQRVDPEVRFDFGTTGPVPDKFNAHRFSILWMGSVLAPETGEYEFVVRTEHAARLYVNGNRKPLIDAWVKSGTDTEYRGSIFLVGGRAYPIRLDFSKAKQGVDDSKKTKKEPPPVKASVALLWKPPGRAVDIIPARNLLPVDFPETLAVATRFPPDDRSLGWERATTVSKAWEQAETEGALDTADYVMAHLRELAGVDDNVNAPDRPAKLREFGRRFVERAFRRPLTDEQKRLFVDRVFDSAKDPESAVKRVVLLTLKSPRFLYREVGGGQPGFDVACRLSFALWDSPPNQELINAAASGQLATREQALRQAERMLADPRAHAKLHAFLLTWLKVDRAPDVAKDPKRFPGFDPAVVSDLRASLDLFLDDAVWGEGGDFRRLLLADDLYLNGRLAKFYGASLPADAPFQRVKLNPDQRAGVLTHPYLMAVFAYTGSTSPIHRGVFIARGVLGLTLRPPPEAFAPLAEDLHPDLTTRERVLLQTKPASCQTCHGVINSLGFTMERFDPVGRYREKDNGKPVDSTGSYQTRSGETVTFAGVRDLANYLASGEEVHAAFAEHLFHHLVQQPVRAYGPDTLARLRESFARSGFSIRKLAAEVAATAAVPPAGGKMPAAGAKPPGSPPG